MMAPEPDRTGIRESAVAADSSSADPPLGRRARKALATRTAMFEAGLSAFEHRPTGLVSVLDITEAADVAKGVFYLHFRGKDDYLIALWEYVHRSFLDSLRERTAACDTKRARIEAAARYYRGMLADAPRRCRYWLRMSSYFGDEIGQPGEMSRRRQEYLRQLAALLGDVRAEDVEPADLRAASTLDGASWGLICQTLQLGVVEPDEERFVRAITSAVEALESTR